MGIFFKIKYFQIIFGHKTAQITRNEEVIYNKSLSLSQYKFLNFLAGKLLLLVFMHNTSRFPKII